MQKLRKHWASSSSLMGNFMAKIPNFEGFRGSKATCVHRWR